MCLDENHKHKNRANFVSFFTGHLNNQLYAHRHLIILRIYCLLASKLIRTYLILLPNTILLHGGWLMMMMMMMNCFWGMVDPRKAFNLTSSRDHCHRSSPSQISDTPRAGFEPAQNLSSSVVEWSCAVVITTAPQWFNLIWFNLF